MPVQFESGTWVKEDDYALLVVPISTIFDKGKTVFFNFKSTHGFPYNFHGIDMQKYFFWKINKAYLFSPESNVMIISSIDLCPLAR